MKSSKQRGGDARPVIILTGAGGRLGSAFCRKYSARYQIVAVWYRRRPVASTHRQYLIDPLEPDRQLQPTATQSMTSRPTCGRTSRSNDW